MIHTISSFENSWFPVEAIIAMRDDLDRKKAELWLSKNSVTRDWNEKARIENKLSNDIKCLTENIWPSWPSLSNQNAN